MANFTGTRDSTVATSFDNADRLVLVLDTITQVDDLVGNFDSAEGNFDLGGTDATSNPNYYTANIESSGEYIARPVKKGKASVVLYAKIDGKKTKMGAVEFRVKEVPPPKAKVQLAKQAGGTLVIEKMQLVNSGGVLAELKDFDFKGVRYLITSYRLTGMYKGEQMKEDVKGPAFSDKMINIIKNTKSGNTITISNIQAKRVDTKNTKVRQLDPLVLEIK